MALHYARGLLELARGRDEEALAAFRAAERLAGRLAAPHTARHASAGAPAAGPRAPGRDRARRAGPRRPGRAGPRRRGDAHRPGGAAARPGRPARGDRRARAGPRRLRSGDAGRSGWLQAFLLEAIARDALGDPAAAGRALERALDLAEPDGALLCVPALPGAGTARAPRPARHRARRPDRRDPQPARRAQPAARRRAGPRPPAASRSAGARLRVLRYLPTNLSAPEIAGELYVSRNTVRTHMRHLYAKLGAHPGRGRQAGPRPRPARRPLHCAARPRVQADGRGRRVWPVGFRASRQVRWVGVTGWQVMAADPDHDQRDDQRERHDPAETR